ncbi:4,4'-diaponeurosporenoate glycosyltransferase [bacterium BMS3Bbin04]|nr:4,4'-diaponeurosporenoate glycosyltransferase [bacterium BMS3Bbin04]
MFLIPIIFVPLLYILAVTLFNALSSPMLKHGYRPRSTPRVSVLVPARNEEITLHECLQGLRAQNWPDYEIIVLDDNSIDDTWSIIEHHAKADSRVRGLRGSDIPEGWVGKTWACQQLVYEATSEIFIFTDADNQHAPDAIRNTVGWMQAKRLTFLTALPQQILRSFGARLILPTMDYLVYCLLPMRLTLSLPQKEISAASGQWLAITKETYHQLGGHAAVKSEVVEDMALVRRAKRQGLRTLILAGTDLVFSKTHERPSEIWQGLRKNMFYLCGGSRSILAGQAGFMSAATVLPYFLLAFSRTRPMARNAVILNMLTRAVLTLKYRHPAELILFHPVGVLTLIGIAIDSMKNGEIRWKGRVINLVSNVSKSQS